MARIKFFADMPTGETLEWPDGARGVDYRSSKDIRGYDPLSAAWVKITRMIEIKPNPSRHECDDRCMNATGRVMKCECACGGKNHGRGAFVCEAA
jgi:hypothetical protein